MSWTDERVDLLKELWADGLSCSQIAGRLGGVTRNAVIGKVSRLKLPMRRKCSKWRAYGPTKRQRKPRPRPWRDWKPKPTPVSALFAAEPFAPTYIELVIPENERRSLVDLGEKDCRWPIGDPRESGFHFCGRPQATGLPYCAFHARRAFSPPVPRRQRVIAENTPTTDIRVPPVHEDA